MEPHTDKCIDSIYLRNRKHFSRFYRVIEIRGNFGRNEKLRANTSTIPPIELITGNFWRDDN